MLESFLLCSLLWRKPTPTHTHTPTPTHTHDARSPCIGDGFMELSGVGISFGAGSGGLVSQILGSVNLAERRCDASITERTKRETLFRELGQTYEIADLDRLPAEAWFQDDRDDDGDGPSSSSGGRKGKKKRGKDGLNGRISFSKARVALGTAVAEEAARTANQSKKLTPQSVSIVPSSEG